jgi:putative DNA methylase
MIATTAKSFIETQFPVSKLSKESYKERKAGSTQTLTSLGRWHGRKPLILVRAAILGSLLRASDDPQKDREIFLKLLTMNEDRLWRRKSKAIPLPEIYVRLTPRERERWFEPESDGAKPKFKKGITRQEREVLQRIVFMRLSYDEKLMYCDRPEHLDGPSPQAWEDINAHLGTTASSLPELVHQLGDRRFGHVPLVGDTFCGGGSVPFEAARIGCKAYGSDLNPVAALLTWAALHIVGGGEKVAKQARQAQQEVYSAVNRQIIEWRIGHNERGWRADAYLYCHEVICPECGWRVPLAPSWVIGKKLTAWLVGYHAEYDPMVPPQSFWTNRRRDRWPGSDTL